MCVKCEEVRFVLVFSLPIQSGVVTNPAHHTSSLDYRISRTDVLWRI